jgi:uncharacterized protein (DUF697 family)
MTGRQDTSKTPDKSSALESAAASAMEREMAASRLVERFSLLSGAAALMPLPFVDIAAVGGIQIDMVRRLSRIYGVPFSANRGKAIITSIAGALLPASAATSTMMTLASALKFLPGLGTTVAVLSMPVFSACATYVIGKVFIKHFASGGTLLDFELPDYREFIKAQKEKFQSRSASGEAPAGGEGASGSAASSAAPKH